MNWIERRIKNAERGNTELDLSIDPVSSGIGPKDKLYEIPLAVLDLKHLTRLDLSGQPIKRIPPNFQNLGRLTDLSFRSNPALDLGQDTALPSGLTRLDLAFVKLGSFHFNRLLRLKHLNLSGCKITDIPHEVTDLADLEILDLTANPLQSLPKELTRLERLRSIHLGSPGSGLSEADFKIIAQLACLEELVLYDFLSETSIFDIAAEVASLRSLELHRCLLPELPYCWRRLADLTQLVIEHTPQSIPAIVRGIERIEAFTRLQRLSLELVALHDLVPHLSALKELKSLEVWNAPLDDLTGLLFCLNRLEHLTLVGTSIQSCPSDISTLQNLKSLNLSENPLRSLPEQMPDLRHLEVLWLCNNDLRSLPARFCDLQNLTKLSLSRNLLPEWPREILELLGLKVLDLSYSEIETIPTDVRRLKNLHSLNVSHCKVTAIPSEVSQLEFLKELNISGNRIQSPQPEIVAGGTAAIQEYFCALLESSSTQLFEAKLIIVGAGEVGKTCLARKLVDPGYDIEKNKQSIATTRGIDIREWHAATDITSDFKINLWDFGGQEIYHATHQFFLTKRSLYLFVWDARREDHIQGMNYWLSIVKLLSDASPVLMVLNKSDIRIKEIDKGLLRGKFDNITGFYTVSALTGQGVAQLARDVRMQIARLPHVGDEWPAKWTEVRSALERDGRNYIDEAEYLAICEKVGLSPSQADTLSFYLHNLGVILHFREDPILKDIVILKPDWGTNAVYAVLDTKNVQERNGRFSFEDLNGIWSQTAYPSSSHVELLQLMKKFELCFQLGETDEYIAPELLSEIPPKIRWEESDSLHFEYHYDFMPAGIITRFIARNHLLIEGENYWRNGALLAWEGNRALVAAEPINRKIRISAKGKARKEMLSVVRRDLELIHKTLNDLQVQQMVPCVCYKCSLASDPFLYEYQRLRTYHEEHIGEILCETNRARVSVEQLLTGVFSSSELIESAPRGEAEPRLYIGKVQNYYAGERKMTAALRDKSRAHGPWFSGIFYLVVTVSLIVLLSSVSKYVSWWAFPIVVIGGFLGLVVIGALQLRQDARLSQQNFLKLMALSFRQLSLLKQGLPPESPPGHGEDGKIN